MAAEYLKNDLFEGILGKNEYLRDYKEKLFTVEGTVLICIHYPGDAWHQIGRTAGFDDVIQVEFWDIDGGCNYTFPTDQLIVLKRFIINNKDKKFLVHCSAGKSRSSAVGMAIECIVNYDGDKYAYATGESDIRGGLPRYTPNMNLYDQLMDLDLSLYV